MPVGRAAASVASTLPIGSTTALAWAPPAVSEPRWTAARTDSREARASRGGPASATVPQAWHSPHRPAHLADCHPHSVQR